MININLKIYQPILLDLLLFKTFNVFQISSEWSAKTYLSKNIIVSSGSSPLILFDFPIFRDKSNLFPHNEIYKKKKLF